MTDVFTQGPTGGASGAAVVPAEQVVAATRQDQPLTQLGLVAAIAALPVGGGYVYLGAGTLALSSTVVVDDDIKLVGAGIGATIITPPSGLPAFSIGNFGLVVEDIELSGDDSVGQAFILNTAGSGETIFITRVHAHNIEIIFDNNNLGHEVKITDSLLSAGGVTPFLLLDGPSQSWYVQNSRLDGEIDAPTTIFAVGNSQITSGAATNLALGISSKFAGCTITATTMTFGLDSQITGSRILGDITAGNLCRFSNCSIENDVIAAGVQLSISGCNIETFSSSGFSGHTIHGNVFEGGGDTVLLDDTTGCKVSGNVNCQVLESGTSDSNQYANILPTSTLTGASSVVTDAQRFAWVSPDVLTTTDNAFFARIPVQIEQGVRLLSVEVETAPTGASLLVDFRLGTRATGVLAAAFATVTVTAGSFTGSATVAGITILPTQFLVCEITQVGSVIAGSNLTAVARA